VDANMMPWRHAFPCLLLATATRSMEATAMSPPTAFVGLSLVDGETPLDGRLLVKTQTAWGSVCSDGWSEEDAAVACRQLFGPRGRPSKDFSDASAFEADDDPGSLRLRGVPALMAEVDCAGDEEFLWDCAFSGTDCADQSWDVYLICEIDEAGAPADQSTPSARRLTATTRPTPEPTLPRDKQQTSSQKRSGANDRVLAAIVVVAVAALALAAVSAVFCLVRRRDDGGLADGIKPTTRLASDAGQAHGAHKSSSKLGSEGPGHREFELA